MTSSTTNECPSVSVERLDRRGAPSLEFLVCRPIGETSDVPVLFLHGAFAGAWCWQESWLPRIGASGRFAAAVSLRGHGGSEGRDRLRRAGLGDFLDDLIHAIRAMPSPPIVVAHSLGGLLAQRLLGRVVTGSVAIRGLVLIGSLPPEGLALMGPWLGMTTWVAALTGIADVGRTSAFADRLRRSGDGTWNATMEAAHAAWAGDVATTALIEALIPLPVVPAWIAKVPALVLRGAEDPLIDVTTAARTATYHCAEYADIPQAGHYPMLGRHAASGADALLRWIDSMDRPDTASTREAGLLRGFRQPWVRTRVAPA